MEAGNKGATEAGGTSVGLHIQLPHEQECNKYVKIRSDYRYFFLRRLMFVKYALAYVVMPGGMGTIDELSEAFVLAQTKRTPSASHYPVPEYLLERLPRLGPQHNGFRGLHQGFRGGRSRHGLRYARTGRSADSQAGHPVMTPSKRPPSGSEYSLGGLFRDSLRPPRLYAMGPRPSPSFRLVVGGVDAPSDCESTASAPARRSPRRGAHRRSGGDDPRRRAQSAHYPVRSVSPCRNHGHAFSRNRFGQLPPRRLHSRRYA